METITEEPIGEATVDDVTSAGDATGAGTGSPAPDPALPPVETVEEVTILDPAPAELQEPSTEGGSDAGGAGTSDAGEAGTSGKPASRRRRNS